MFKLTFETVGQRYLHKYCDADPMYYSHTKQTKPNSIIPDEEWHLVERESKDYDGIFRQYETLKQWSDEDINFVRSPKMYELKSEPIWRELEL